jgi:hypothetical protein
MGIPPFFPTIPYRNLKFWGKFLVVRLKLLGDPREGFFRNAPNLGIKKHENLVFFAALRPVGV